MKSKIKPVGKQLVEPKIIVEKEQQIDPFLGLPELRIIPSQGGYVFRWGSPESPNGVFSICDQFDEAIKYAIELQKENNLGKIVFQDENKKYE
jgi:hypothetical protein